MGYASIRVGSIRTRGAACGQAGLFLALTAGCMAAALLPARADTIPNFTADQMGGTLRRTMTAEPQNLNPLTGKDVYERLVNEFVYERLIVRHPDTLEFEGQLAERWDVSPDGRVVTFHLRPEARFSDGHPVTADDVVFTYETVTDAKIDCRSLASYFKDCRKCEKVDDRTVRYTWKEPYFKTLEVSGSFNPILPKHIYEKHVLADPESKDPKHFNKLVQGFIGSGPYTFVKWTTGQEIVLARNENYWGKPRAFDRIVYRIITDTQASVQAFLARELDDLPITPDWWDKLKDHEERGKTFRMYRYAAPANGYSYVAWNNAKYRSVTKSDGTEERIAEPHPIFGDKRVRRAMTHLIDRKRVLKHLYYDIGQVATGTFWPHSPQHDPAITPWRYDRAEAMRLLKEAGWEDRDRDGWLEDRTGKRFSFEWTFSTSGGDTRLPRLLKEAFRRVGIEVRTRFIEWSVFVLKLDRREFDAIILGWGGGGVEADPYQIWHSDAIADQGHNFITLRNAEADRLIMTARAELDPAKRNVLYHRFHRLLHEQQPYTFFIARESLRLVSTRVENVNVRRVGIDTEEWWIPKEKRLKQGGGAP